MKQEQDVMLVTILPHGIIIVLDSTNFIVAEMLVPLGITITAHLVMDDVVLVMVVNVVLVML